MRKLCLFVTAVLAGCHAAPPQDHFRAAEATPVETVTVVPRTLHRTVRLSGVLAPAAEMTINVDFAAPVQRLLVEEGHSVDEGQPLLEFDTRKLALQLEQTGHRLEQALAEFKHAEQELSRLRSLKANHLVASQRVDDARFAQEHARARLRELEGHRALIQRDLGRRILASPADATVVERHIDAGQSIVAHQPLMTLHATNSLQVSVFVGEVLLPYMRIGNPGRVSTAVGEFETAIHAIAANAGADTGNYEVRLLLENRDRRLRAGMTVDASLSTSAMPDRLLVPASALVSWRGQHVVYIATAGVAERRSVDLSLLFEDQVVVEEGVVPGEQLIVRGAEKLTQGSPVKIVGRKT